jgi:hypothetical protein
MRKAIRNIFGHTSQNGFTQNHSFCGRGIGNTLAAHGVLMDIRTHLQEVLMSTRRAINLVLLSVCVLLLYGCAATAPAGSVLTNDAFTNKAADFSDAPGIVSQGEAGLAPLPTSAAPAAGQAVSGDPAAKEGPGPLIIKQAQIRLQVKNTDQAIDRLTQIVSDTQGYIVSNRVWFEQSGKESYKYATYTIGVPVDAFEVALRRLRSMAIKVVDENASGQDVSEEYVDLESRLRNLEATRDRIRGFLDQAQTVEESLRINNELAAIEGQIEQVQGRMRFLAGRAAFSTITIQLDPELPAEPSPTPTPVPVPYRWDPGATFQNASSVAVKFGQLLADVLIYLVVWVPFAIPVLLIWIVYKIVSHKRKPAQP